MKIQGRSSSKNPPIDPAQAARKSAILIRGLQKSYGKTKALVEINLDVKVGEVFGFLGPNGAGKTTAIRCMLDLIRPDLGDLRVLDVDPQANPMEVRRRTGYLPGELHLDDNLTALQLFHLFDSFRGTITNMEKVKELSEKLKLKLDKPVRNFSKGNKQKVGIVQAFMHEPELLLLDEPTSGLDPLMQQEVLTLVRHAKDRGATVFFSTHILSEAQAVTDRCAIVRDGVIAEISDLDSLIKLKRRTVWVRFAEPVSPEEVEQLDGVRVILSTGRQMRIQVEGEIGPLLKLLAFHEVQDLETVQPSLEDIFLEYYKQRGKETEEVGGRPE